MGRAKGVTGTAQITRSLAVAGIASLVMIIGACAPEASPTASSPNPSTVVNVTPTALVVTAPDADAEGRLPEWAMATVTGQCEGDNTSPALEWSEVPAGTVSIAVTMVNPDELTYPHWVVTDIPADVTTLSSAPDGDVTVGTRGRSFMSANSYVGPCWQGATYRYTVYALDVMVGGTGMTSYDQLLDAIDGHVLAQGSVDTLAPRES